MATRMRHGRHGKSVWRMESDESRCGRGRIGQASDREAKKNNL
jgi:hypothetical protein